MPGDVDLRAGVLRELDRADERGHSIRIRPLGRVEEHAHELRFEREHLRIETREVRRRAADVGVDVLVQLAAESGEAPDDRLVGRKREFRALTRLQRACMRIADLHTRPHETEEREREREHVPATESIHPLPPDWR